MNDRAIQLSNYVNGHTFPRDVDPEVVQTAGVLLVDIDGLKTRVAKKLHVRREAIPQVERIIAQYVDRFSQWHKSHDAVPVVASLTKKAESVRRAELERLFTRGSDLTDRERTLITEMSMTIVSKLLHTTVTKIRDKGITNRSEGLAHVRVLEELFELNIA